MGVSDAVACPMLTALQSVRIFFFNLVSIHWPAPPRGAAAALGSGSEQAARKTDGARPRPDGGGPDGLVAPP